MFRRVSGFTMIELVVVIVILGILASIAVPKYVDMSGSAQTAACKANQGAIQSACSMYYAHKAATTGTPSFPAAYTDVTLYADGTVPVCPAAGTYAYSTTMGKVTCSKHP